MKFRTKTLALAAVAASAVGFSAGGASALTVIVTPIYNAADPGGAFTPGESLGTILNQPLFETKGKGSLCTVTNGCTYDFTFTLSGLAPGQTTQVQLQAAAQTSKNVTTQEVLNYDLFSGTPGNTTFTPITSSTFIAASTIPNTVGQVINAALGDGTYYVQVEPSQVAVSGETGSGSLTVVAVPEPATWAVMLIGFGGIGATMRRRRGLALAA